MANELHFSPDTHRLYYKNTTKRKYDTICQSYNKYSLNHTHFDDHDINQTVLCPLLATSRCV